MLSGTLLVCYNDSITVEQKVDNLKKLCNAGYVIYSTGFTSLWRNSRDVLKTELYTFVPVSVLLLLITIFTSIQISRINLVRSLKNFAVYYMMGCSWRRCKCICAISSLWSMLAAIILNVCAWSGFMLTDKIAYDGMLIKYMNRLYLCAAILYLAVILLYQNILLGRYTPYQIMRGDNND